MGLTPLEGNFPIVLGILVLNQYIGLPGGTRSGTVDPSLVFHLFGKDNASDDVTSKGITVSKGEFNLNKTAGVRLLALKRWILMGVQFQGMCGTTDFKAISDKAAQGSKAEGLALGVFQNRILVRDTILSPEGD